MLIRYTFNAEEISVLDKARLVFNRFTGENYSLEKYIKFAVQQAVTNEVETARIVAAEMGSSMALITKKAVRHATH